MKQFKSQAEAEAAGVYVSKVKSFVKREGRLTNAQARAIEENWSAMGIDYRAELLNFEEVFKQRGPVVLEIGFGMGKSLVQMATEAPDTNFLGIEVHRPGVGSCINDAVENGLKNLRVMEHDAVEVFKHMIPDASLQRVQLYFPDPWHKKRHHKRRIVQPEFVAMIKEKLAIGGVFHMATDWENYAEHMLTVMQNAPGFVNTSLSGDFVERPVYRPITKFEVRGQKLGHGVWDLVFERTE
ncbi:tRNA (guanosine(46)-N7)-methyltransferase TrmB [Alteromonas sp. ASW11-130]|uniref:tRNA (guanosine(46)-N7)-methyltransferase TrmB n=1 Tax=Alteromonas sp. ASW11-130 TaxID=3015775 RepID=UPI002241CDAA|nr:tRNA (guanosine(46)-N7)-methyltransferase TrmB [Alteromonas sp. ASW11-130]MCW8091027.1 tRNA (guanosine(46)-N7)-methyltransferase TrmB [Alteromonas sp. ASW11-130]